METNGQMDGGNCITSLVNLVNKYVNINATKADMIRIITEVLTKNVQEKNKEIPDFVSSKYISV